MKRIGWRWRTSYFIILANAGGGDPGGNWVLAFAVMRAENTLGISRIAGPSTLP